MMVDAGSITFGYYTAALVAIAGVALASGTQFAVVGLWRRREAVYLSYAMLCLCVATLSFANALLHTATDVTVATAALRTMIGAAAVSFLPFVVFIRAYTGGAAQPRLQLAVGAAVGLFTWLNLDLPGTVFFTRVIPGPGIALPWGERLYDLAGSASNWGLLFHALSYVAFLWALSLAVAQMRGRERLRGALLAICLLSQFAALLWGDIVVDALGHRYPYLDAFSFLPFVLLMGVSLATQLHQRTVQLEQTTRRLEAEAHIRREAEFSLRHVAYHDSLTGLPNRLRALDHLAELHTETLARGQHGAVLLIDLDNFKTINDALGHPIGDRMLEAIADRLLAAAPSDAVLARLGGDEFVLVLGPLAGTAAAVQAQAHRVAESMVARLAEPVAVDSRILAVGASVGVALFPAGEQDVADLLRRADIALYRAKAAGRNAVRLFLEPMQQEADTRLALERGLRTALEQERMPTQFALHFQPQVNRRGELIGAEALLRWQHPQLGELSPTVFIPLAEETGLIHALGTWVIGQACMYIRAWDRDGVAFGGRLAVNVSAWQLNDPRFATQLEAQVRAAGIEPSRLTLELTESALLRDFDSALETLGQLSAAGFRLALDDFGTGYSSLSYLQRLPLDVLKVDRAFVSELTPNSANPLASFIVDVAHRLGIAAVAEGVETVPQRLALERLGCDGLQGYLICRPVDEPGFRRWLTEHQQARALPQAQRNTHDAQGARDASSRDRNSSGD
ncbi:putative bifunctional diguanylate cyclase/phosphodiesterase [Frateuria terrea]|uniref:Diguanylate cyclase (GGDEF) domain-containing protein n=1 Tax=Frateuria terrea TaxID=529704 RepID=A0A1H6Y148_9GAMM|nr:EAL domain-containing protein [Frateuria terrea]SEJ35019.1 diguanylate cyclase (GGDEF) domain-containing protein [Frateuria terrea]SFP49830.1 diguanylate cyclase (GGDEF) domain-containing protein [Frateuria terrea]